MDIFDWRLLLLVGVFGAGWTLARVDIEQIVSRARRVPDLVMEGIGNLMRGNHESAAKDFVESGQPLGRVNAELHFAAGELFRIQGNYEGAISAHKGLIACSELDEKEHARARYELGLDYQKGGFIDLAQKCFMELEATAHANDALRHLINIHMYSKAWKSAIDDEERFARNNINAELRRSVIAHLYCELAAVEGATEGEKLLEEALRRNPNCGRAWMMRAEAALGRGDNAAALDYLTNLRNSPELMPVAASLIMRTYAAAGKEDRGEALLLSAYRSHPTPQMFEKVYDALAETRGHTNMAGFVREAMRNVRGVVAVAKWLEVERAGTEGARRAELDALMISIGWTSTGFDCSKCEFHASSHYWQCPVCLAWETMLLRVVKSDKD